MRNEGLLRYCFKLAQLPGVFMGLWMVLLTKHVCKTSNVGCTAESSLVK